MDYQNPFSLNFCFETGLELKGHSTIEANTCARELQCAGKKVLLFEKELEVWGDIGASGGGVVMVW